jgi:monoamine oxidase
MSKNQKRGRRDFLKQMTWAGAAAATATTWKSQASAVEAPLSEEQVDVVIIGAGFAGITAAERLWESGYKIKVLEARDRCGGRTWTQDYGGVLLDSGGQWIGPGQDYVYRRVRHYGVKTFSTYDSGLNIIETEREKNGRPVLHRYHAEGGLTPGKALRIFKGTVLDFSALYDGLDRLAEGISLGNLWESENAQALDSITLESWIQQQWSSLGPLKLKPADERVCNIMRAVIHTVFSASPAKISLLHALFYVKAGGGMDSLINVTGGAQQDRFVYGTQDLLNKMKAPFEKDIVLSSPVRRIEQSESDVLVISDRIRVRASKVIVTLPPALVSRIEFSPKLTAQREMLNQSYPMGNTIKIMAVYDRPFWRQEGLSGQFFSPYTPVTAGFDNSHPGTSEGILVGFMVGPNADVCLTLTPEQRQRWALESFAKFFGPRALNPLRFYEKVWAEEEYSRGAYGGYRPPGVITSFRDVMYKPEGRIHFAGTETAAEWNGYIEGAIRSGYRAAREVMI